MKNKHLEKMVGLLCIIFISFLFTFSTPVFAITSPSISLDLVHISITVIINLTVNFLAIYLISYYYLAFKNFKKIFLTSVVISILGVIIDVISVIMANILASIIDPQYSWSNRTTVLVFSISFVLLWIMYYFIIRKVFGVTLKKKSIIAAVFLSLITNPIWILILCISFPSFFNKINWPQEMNDLSY
jgi:hypothetical protein